MQAVSVTFLQTGYDSVMQTGRPPKFERSGFGDRIFKARQQLGLSQMQVAETLDVTQQTYAGWERRTTALKPEHIASLADILHVSSDYLLGRETSPQRGTGPAGKARRVFDEVSKLPRNRQQRILATVEDMLTAQRVASAS